MTLSSELSVKFNCPHRTCVLDPLLALSIYGIPLVKQLATVMDIWVGKEFWHLLENIQFYLQHPELLLLNRAMPDRTRYITSFSSREIIQSLQAWEKFRQETDLESVKLFWVGDRLNESSLPNGLQPDTIRHYEILARSLDARIPRLSQASETLTSLLSDTAALSATLSSSFILTRQYLSDNNESLLPEICLELESFGIPCHLMKIEDEMVALEKDYLRQLFVQVGLSKFLWAGLRLSVLHLFVPSILPPGTSIGQNTESQIINDAKLDEFSRLETNPWAGTRCFLYQF